MLMRYHNLPIIIIFLLIFSPVLAENKTDPIEATYLNISVTKTTEVTNDLLTASLKLEFENEDPKLLQSSINESMTKAIDISKSYKSVLTHTNQYYVYQFDKDQGNSKNKQTPKKMWRGGQILTLTSLTSDDIFKLAGKLQESGMLMQSLTFSLSNDKREAARDSLMLEALTSLIQKSKQAAKALNREYDKLSFINIDPPNQQLNSVIPLMGAANTTIEKIISPVAQPGTSEVSITITATSILK